MVGVQREDLVTPKTSEKESRLFLIHEWLCHFCVALEAVTLLI